MSHTVALEIDGVAYDDKALEGVTIQWGRQSVQDQPEPTSCSVSFLRESTIGTIDVTDIKVGAQLQIDVTPSGQSAARRFFGIITDVDVNYETINVAAVSTGIYTLRQLGYTIAANNVAFAVEENASLAVSQVYYGAALQSGVDLLATPLPTRYPQISVDGDYPNGHPDVSFLFTTNPTEPPVTWRLLEFVNTWAKSVPSGVIWEDMLEVGGIDNVNVIFAGQLARDVPLTAAVTLAQDEILLDWDSGRDLGLFCTASTISYTGPVNTTTWEYDTPGEEAYLSSLTTTWGGFAKDYSVPLVYAADAAELAKVNVQNGEVPGYVTQVTIPLATLTGARQSTLVTNLLIGSLWATPTLATGLPTLYFLEGYTETISRADWTLRLMLSDPSNSWYGQRWQDVTPTLQWDQVGATTTWLDLQGQEL